MRTIKFKAKRINNGDWVVGSLAIHGKRAYILPEENIGQPLAVFEKVDPATVCQFTDLTDKNGKEVYEGDVLRGEMTPYYSGDGREYFYDVYDVVKWNEDTGGFCMVITKNPDVKSDDCFFLRGVDLNVHFSRMKMFEVVGSIHDPEWKNKLDI